MADKPLGLPNPSRKSEISYRIQNGYSNSGSKDSSQMGSDKGGHGRLRPPISIDAEHRFIISKINQLIKQVQDFQQGSQVPEDVDYAECETTAKEILQCCNMEEESVDSVQDFEEVLQSREYGIPDAIKDRPEFDHLVKFSNRCSKFDCLLPQVRQQLDVCSQDHLEKYCVSFIEEPDEGDVASAKNYEDLICEYKESLHQGRGKLEETWDKYQEIRKPFMEQLIPKGGEANNLIGQSCCDVIKMAETMKRWALADRAYPGKLQREIAAGHEKKSKLGDQMKEIQRQMDRMGPVRHRRQIARKYLHDDLEQHKRERRKIQNSKEVVKDLLERTQKELEETREELKKNEERINQRKSNSPRYLDTLWEKSSSLKSLENRLVDRIDTFERQLGRLAQNEDDCTKIVNHLEGQLAEEDYEIKEVNDKVEQLFKDFVEAENELVTLNSKIQKAKKIRNTKLDHLTLRRIFYQRMDPYAAGQWAWIHYTYSSKCAPFILFMHKWLALIWNSTH